MRQKNKDRPTITTVVVLFQIDVWKCNTGWAVGDGDDSVDGQC